MTTEISKTYAILTEQGWVEFFMKGESFLAVSAALYSLETPKTEVASYYYGKTVEAGIIWG